MALYYARSMQDIRQTNTRSPLTSDANHCFLGDNKQRGYLPIFVDRTSAELGRPGKIADRGWRDPLVTPTIHISPSINPF